MHCVALGENFPTSYLVFTCKIGVDTAENEPLEVWGKIQCIIHLAPYSRWATPAGHRKRKRSKSSAREPERTANLLGPVLGCFDFSHSDSRLIFQKVYLDFLPYFCTAPKS